MLVGMTAPALPITTHADDRSNYASARSEPKMFNGLFSKFGKSQPLPDLIALQSDAVRSIVGDITDLQEGEWEDRDWVYLAINHEVLIEDGRRSSSQASVLAHRPGADLEDLDFRLSWESKGKLLALRDAMAKPGEDPWTILDLTVERSGQFNFTFGYGPPPRINGNLLHSPLSGLLERYLAEKEAKQ
jgi:hypothetical protein